MKAGVKIVNGEEIAVYVNGNSNIVQSNYMINNKERWTVAEERLFLTVLAMTNAEDKALNLYKIPVSTFVDLWGVDKDRVFTEVISVLESLRKKGIYSKTNDYDVIPALTRAIYNRGSEYCLVQLHPDLQKHVIDIRVNGGYTSYRLENALNLNRARAGTNAHRLYELCRSYARKGKTITRDVPISELRKALSLVDKYKRLGDIEKKILKPCMEKINGNTDIKAAYTLTGRGQKAVVTFSVSLIQRETLPELIPDDVPELPEGDDMPYWCDESLPTERDESISFIRNELGKLPDYEVTPEDVELLLEYCFQNGCSSSISVADYASVNVQYCRIRWRRVKHKGGYVRNVFKENHGGWYPREV